MYQDVSHLIFAHVQFFSSFYKKQRERTTRMNVISNTKLSYVVCVCVCTCALECME